MVGIALEKHLLAVEFETEVWRELDGAHSKLLANLVDGVALLVKQCHLGSV